MSLITDTTWAVWAVERIREAYGQQETPLIEFPLPAHPGIRLLFKDESAHPSGSLKHRLAASLAMFGTCNGDIGPNSTLVDASSGSTAVSEAYFARELGLRFIAVVPSNTSPSKLRLIESMGGTTLFADTPTAASQLARQLGDEPDHVFLDQFSNASVQTNWRSGNLASALFDQLPGLGITEPDWVVVGAGTGGTSSTFARYVRYTGTHTRVAVADPEGSAYYPSWLHQDRTQQGTPSRIEGIGRPTVEASFMPQLIDEVIQVPDVWPVAAMRVLAQRGLTAGPSTGTNLIGCLNLADRMRKEGREGVIVSIMCDSAERYTQTYRQDGWLAAQGLYLGNTVPDLTDHLEGLIPAPWA